ncbi:universal stress protein [Aurantibacter crassamenti]|uniref:universal stress protein n=1 Tax=Aurantibacter crassamenti TaxID=1837375 RepID=UPI001939B781|nr:universal stress protein [Aurantibacter crassamenti]MBM1105190.1 universal stress protein [Aurantibacter crassamenti]
MIENIQPFKSLLFGFAFSPNIKANIAETYRLASFFNAKLILLHVGAKTDDKQAKIYALLKELNIDQAIVEIVWKEGKPVETILEACENFKIDLLILGAQQHENVFRFYVGSIARKLTRKVCCSIMLLIKPALERVPCKHIVVNGLDAPETALAITDAFYVANYLGAQKVTIVEEILQKEIHVTVEDDRSLKKANIVKARLRHREDYRVRTIISNLPEQLTQNINIKTQSIFGKRGYSIGHYAEVVRADLLVMNAPEKTSIYDRIFPHDIEHILSDLPTDLLIIRNRA